MKQETLEEASKRAVKSGLFKDETLFVAGVRWQQEQDKNKYSDEEVNYLLFAFKKYLGFREEIDSEEWFEKFKKK
jgi:hypothetical protein